MATRTPSSPLKANPTNFFEPHKTPKKIESNWKYNNSTKAKKRKQRFEEKSKREEMRGKFIYWNRKLFLFQILLRMPWRRTLFSSNQTRN
jgi:hypothetical protein